MVGLAGQQSLEQEDSTYQNEQDVGALFRQARLERQWSIEDVARLTRIRQLYLTAIENGRIDQLPGKIYTVGFIKTYAHLLELDPLEILRRLKLDLGESFELNKLVIAVPTQSQERPSLKLVALTSALAITLLSGAIVWTFWEKEVRQLWASLTAPDGVGFEAEADVADSLVENENFVSVPREEPNLLEQDKGIIPSLPPLESSHVTEAKNDTLAEPEPLAPTASSNKPLASQPSGDGDKITIVASKDSWVQVLDGQGKSIFVRLMHSGDTFTVPSENGPYLLNTGNAGGIRLKLNNGITNLLGADGKVMRAIPVTPEHVRQLGVIVEEPSAQPSIEN